MKYLSIALIMLLGLQVNAQTNAIRLTPMQVYKTYADYAAGKPAEGIEVIEDGDKYGTKHALVVNDNGTTKTFAVEDIPYYAYTEHDGLLIRPYDGKAYYALVLGKTSYYHCTCEGDLMNVRG